MFKFCPYCGHKVFQQTKNGFQCLNCKKWTHYASNPAVSVVVKAGDEGLVAVRGIEPGKGMMDLVGGFLEYGENPAVGAVREFAEETGFKIKDYDLKFMGMWIDKYYYQGEDQLILNIIYLLELPEKFNGTPADDVSDLIWLPVSKKPNFAFSYLYKVWDRLKE